MPGALPVSPLFTYVAWCLGTWATFGAKNYWYSFDVNPVWRAKVVG
jgi:hypothetical protein